MQPLKTTVSPSGVVAHRLGAALGEVDDRQPPVHEPGVPVQPEAGAVRAARGEGRAHPLERVALRARAGAQLEAEAAHAQAARRSAGREAATSASNSRA